MRNAFWAPRNAAYDEFFSAVLTGDVAALAGKTFCSDFNLDALRPIGYLEDGDDGDGTNSGEGTAALHTAAANGHAEMAKFLLAKGADVNARDAGFNSVFTPLLVAASESNAEMVQVLLDHGADINQRGDYFEATALHLVLWRGKEVEQKSIDSIKLLLDRGMDVNVTDGEYGLTVLHTAAELGHMGLMKLLLGRGAKINAVTNGSWGKSVLGCASRHGTCDTVEFLLDRGAILDLPALGCSGLFSAASGGNMDVLRLLLRRAQRSVIDTCYELVHDAACREYIDAVELLLDYGFSLEAVNESEETPLVTVCSLKYLRSVAVVDCLLRRRANVTARAGNGDTPLHRAIWLNAPDTAKSLIAAGSDLEARNDSGATPLMYFATSRRASTHHLVALKILLDAGADIHVRDERGRNVLHLLDSPYMNGEFRIGFARAVLERGLDINARDKDGMTPLGRVAQMNFRHKALEALLVAHGAVE